MVLGGFGWFWLVPCFSNYALRYDFCDLDIGCSNESTKDEILSVGPSQPEMIGLDVIVGL